ncbi:MAG: hypothetical protein F4Z87_07260 [Gammaproteobacteria bacterium]|nr:hypothetical protein [Gammaproteobacteria bacterium]
MGTPGELEREGQELRRRFESADETNGVDRRAANRAAISRFQRQFDFWRTTEARLPDGPSGLQLAVILDDLTPYWNGLRERARRQTAYDDPLDG